MTLETGVKALAEAVAVDVKALEDGKVDKVAGKGLSDTNYTQAEKTKLVGIAVEATKNRADSENADKLHTHTVGQVTGLDTALESKVDKQAGKGLSDTNFTQAEKDKLSSLESSKFVGLFVSESALPLSGSEGDYANVDGGVGSDVYRVIWDSSDNKWVRVQGVSTELTDAQIKQQYESNPDTNAFTDDEKAKLASVANNATANRSDSENADKLHTHTIAQVTGLDAALAGKASNTDPRFTDAREWSAATIPQSEVEDGTATTRRAFTAQRLRQGITAWYTGISGALGRTILGRSTADQVRSDLELGTAAQATLTTSNTDGTAGRVLRVGNGGWMGQGAAQSVPYGYPTSIGDVTNQTKVIRSDVVDNGVLPFISGIHFASGDTWGRLRVHFSVQRAWLQGGSASSGAGWTAELYHTGNTTKNPDGTLKASSPVINLYTDKHDLHNDGQFGATPSVVRKSKGVYEINGTLGLRSEGWYLDTPSDRNGNKYFNIEWTQNIAPEAVGGVVDEYRDDIVVTIETFERVWNKDTGLFENGAPIDINDSQDRFVHLRFNEIKVEHEELDDETITRNQE